jgi:hypothetical protein
LLWCFFRPGPYFSRVLTLRPSASRMARPQAQHRPYSSDRQGILDAVVLCMEEMTAKFLESSAGVDQQVGFPPCEPPTENRVLFTSWPARRAGVGALASHIPPAIVPRVDDGCAWCVRVLWLRQLT